jgi:hypothetical protein
MSLIDDTRVLARGTRIDGSPHEGMFRVSSYLHWLNYTPAHQLSQHFHPKYDASGVLRFEYHNLYLNERRFAGAALFGEDIPSIQEFYCVYWELYVQPWDPEFVEDPDPAPYLDWDHEEESEHDEETEEEEEEESDWGDYWGDDPGEGTNVEIDGDENVDANQFADIDFNDDLTMDWNMDEED